MKLHPVGAGDMIRALATLKPGDEDTRRAIARLLGFELAGVDDRKQIVDDPGTRKPGPRHKMPQPETELPSAPMPQEQDFILLPQPLQRSSAAARPLAPARGEPLRQGMAEDLLPSPPFEPLLRPSGERAVVSTMLRIRRRTGAPHISDLIEAAAQMKPLSNLPASWQESVGGVDVLLDVDESMAVFSRDQEWLLSLIRRVVGDGFVTTYSFSGSPSRGVTAEGELVPRPYVPPRSGWPVLLLTDLGIGKRQYGYNVASESEWRDFAGRIRTARCHLIALVPYPRNRWPGITPMDIIQWDRVTSVGSVRSIIGRANRIAHA
jgi:hypothetical protein